MGAVARATIDVAPELLTRAEAHAQGENVTVGEWVDRAITRELRRLEGGRELDGRTRRPGMRGAGARRAPGEMGYLQVADLLGVDESKVKSLVNNGIMVPERGSPGQGHPLRFTMRDVRVACTLLRLRAVATVPTETQYAIGKMLAGADVSVFAAGRFLVLDHHVDEFHIVGSAHLAERLHDAVASTVVSLDVPIEAREEAA